MNMTATPVSSYLYAVCYALDLRAMQKHYNASLEALLKEELRNHFGKQFQEGVVPPSLQSVLLSSILDSLDITSTLDADRRLEVVASATTSPILDFFASSTSIVRENEILDSLSAFRSSFATRGACILQSLRHSFVAGNVPSPSPPEYNPIAPAGPFLGRTRPVYEYIRQELGIRIHGLAHWDKFSGNLGAQPSIGFNVSKIYEVSGILICWYLGC